MCLEVLLEFTADQVLPAGITMDQMDTFEQLHPLEASIMMEEEEMNEMMKQTIVDEANKNNSQVTTGEEKPI